MKFSPIVPDNKLEIIGEKNVLEIQSCIICQDMKSNLLTCCKHQYCRDCIAQHFPEFLGNMWHKWR